MSALDTLLRRFRFVRRLERRVADLEQSVARLEAEAADLQLAFPPGHFYSPLPSRAEIAAAWERLPCEPPFAALDLHEAEQDRLLRAFAAFYAEQPFPERPAPGRRFHWDNASYGAFDAIMLWSMLRHHGSRRVVEVGSGFSSAAMLDLNEHVFDQRMHLTFIDPDMTRLRALLRPGEAERLTLIERRVQDVPLDTFRNLAADDVLFIDSSHVSKIGSDVNHLLFHVLPSLRPGVLVHVHDVAGNFEYPREWLEQGRAWNEQYLLRAFLMYNSVFRIVLFTGWLFNNRHAFFRDHLPLCAHGGGGQLWLRKTA
jgi:predicted O-methyltransferase YrrM